VADFVHLAPFSGLVEAARKQGPLFPVDCLDRGKAREVLRFTLEDERPRDVEVARSWRPTGWMVKSSRGRSDSDRERMPGS